VSFWLIIIGLWLAPAIVIAFVLLWTVRNEKRPREDDAKAPASDPPALSSDGAQSFADDHGIENSAPAQTLRQDSSKG
jgi:uncharacterized SAM-binding protein YcdF (DUF218 family)